MVSIKSVHTVIPSEATPNGTFMLSQSQQINAHTHALTIYIYNSNHNNNIIDTMKHSLAKILVHYYPLAGRLRMIEGGRMEVECNGNGVLLLEAESTNTLEHYGDFKPNAALRPLLPAVDYSEPMENLPLVMVQVTRFASGGLCVGFGISNVVVDGISGTLFVDAWAKLARGGTLGEDEKPLFLDKMAILKSESNDEKSRFEHREFKALPVMIGRRDASEESKKETDLAILKVTREMAEKIKKKANDDDGCLEFDHDAITAQKHRRPYTRYESIAAHIWRSACKARNADYNQPTVVLSVAGIRNRLKPPLPLNYFGNATHPTVTPTCLSGDIASKPLRYGAQKMREAIELLTDEYLRSAFEFIGRQDDLGCLRPKLKGESGCVEAPFLGNPNLNIWSWMSNMPTYGPDFGWGRPVYMGPCEVKGDGKAFIMPVPSSGDGALSVAIRLQTPHVQPFVKFFYQDI